MCERELTTPDDLLDYVFDGKQLELYAEFERWVRGSRRFRAFATSYRGKIRAKLKNARDDASVKDLQAEFEAAALLLRDERFTLEYEKYATTKQRGPDLTVTYRTHTRFNVEVRRIRSTDLDEEDPEAITGKLIAVVCDKAGQMPPGIVNLLWLAADRPIHEADLIRAVTTLRQFAEQKDEAFFIRRGYASAAVFLRQYRQLSAIMLRQPGAATWWLNPLARHPASAQIITALQRLDGG